MSDNVASAFSIQFISQYYQMLNAEPEGVYQFYQASACLSRLEKGQKFDAGLNLVGQANIKTFYSKQSYRDFKVAIESIDSQTSFGGSILTIVHGLCTSNGKAPQGFNQTFVLAPERAAPGEMPMYLVCNDSLRFLSAGVTTDASAPAETPAEAKEVAAAKPVEEKSETKGEKAAPQREKRKRKPRKQSAKAEPAVEPKAEPTPESTADTSAEDDKVEQLKQLEQQLKQQEEQKKQQQLKQQKQQQQNQKQQQKQQQQKQQAEAEAAAAAVVEEPASPVGPSSWASLLFKSTVSASPTAGPMVTPTPPPTPIGDGILAEESAPRKMNSKAIKSPIESNGAESNGRAFNFQGREEMPNSLFVRNLPKNVDRKEVEELFGAHGELTSVQMQPGRGYCFVTYKENAPADAVIELAAAQPLQLGENELSVDRRRRQSERTRGKGRGGRGRGRDRGDRGDRRYQENGDGEDGFVKRRPRGQPRTNSGATADTNDGFMMAKTNRRPRSQRKS